VPAAGASRRADPLDVGADLGPALTGTRRHGGPSPLVRVAESAADLAAYRRLRREAFVDEQALFTGSDRDDWDDHPATVVLVAVTPDGSIVGGVRLTPGDAGRDLAWWNGSRLVVERSRRGQAALGAALVGAACATAEARGALRFEATVQRERSAFFRRLGWSHLGPATVAGRPHDRVRWPIDRIAAQVAATKAPLAGLLDGLQPGGD